MGLGTELEDEMAVEELEAAVEAEVRLGFLRSLPLALEDCAAPNRNALIHNWDS